MLGVVARHVEMLWSADVAVWGYLSRSSGVSLGLLETSDDWIVRVVSGGGEGKEGRLRGVYIDISEC